VTTAFARELHALGKFLTETADEIECKARRTPRAPAAAFLDVLNDFNEGARLQCEHKYDMLVQRLDTAMETLRSITNGEDEEKGKGKAAKSPDSGTGETSAERSQSKYPQCSDLFVTP
jgi:hypothetical protein